MLWEGIDKRKFPRAKYKCRIRIAEQGKEEVFNTFTENIGGGGICVVLGKEVDLFKTAKLELYLAEGEGPIRCGGAIVWVIRRQTGPGSGGYEYDTGIEFTDLGEEGRRRIAALVEEILSA